MKRFFRHTNKGWTFVVQMARQQRHEQLVCKIQAQLEGSQAGLPRS
jgi:hypothetical protein